MNFSTVSVIIPTYNHADFLGKTIQSVLKQTYPYYEIIVVDDASQDHTNRVVSNFNDPRIRYIVSEENLGPAATRNKGIQAAVGDIVSFLDADDLFHPEKLAVHVKFLESHPQVGVTYNSRFELNYSDNTIRDLVRAPTKVTLSDLVLGFPFATSDMVLRKEWLFRVGLFEDDLVWSEELTLNCKLAMAGCEFASVDRALNYRRFESGRIYKDLAVKCESAVRGLRKILADPRFPVDILNLGPKAHSYIYLDYGYIALSQGEISFGQELVREAIRLNPLLLVGTPCSLVTYLLRSSISDEKLDHEAILQRMFDLLPVELSHLSTYYHWATAQGYILKGIRAIMWGRSEAGVIYFSRAVEMGAKISENFLQESIYQLLGFGIEFGADAAELMIDRLTPYLIKVGNLSSVRKLTSSYMINQAFQSYQDGKYSIVSKQILKALFNDPSYLLNRGVISILCKSALKARFQMEA